MDLIISIIQDDNIESVMNLPPDKLSAQFPIFPRDGRWENNTCNASQYTAFAYSAFYDERDPWDDNAVVQVVAVVARGKLETEGKRHIDLKCLFWNNDGTQCIGSTNNTRYVNTVTSALYQQ